MDEDAPDDRAEDDGGDGFRKRLSGPAHGALCCQATSTRVVCRTLVSAQVDASTTIVISSKTSTHWYRLRDGLNGSIRSGHVMR